MDLTAQYELGFNTVNDVNFSMETAHLAKNQILQQAATAMLAQANASSQLAPHQVSELTLEVPHTHRLLFLSSMDRGM